MGRMKLGIGLAGAVIVLLGVVAMITMRSDGSPTHATVARNSTASTSPSVAAPTAAANATTPTSTVAQPSVQDVQKLIAGLTAQIQASPTTDGSTPLTKEQVEAQVRAQLKQLGITY